MSSRYTAICSSVSRYFAGSHTVVFTGFILVLLKIFRYTLRGFYVSALGRFVAPAKQDNDFLPAVGKVHPVTRAVVDTQFRNTIAHRLGIAEIAYRNTANTGGNNGLSIPVFEVLNPLCIVFGFPYPIIILYLIGYKLSRRIFMTR